MLAPNPVLGRRQGAAGSGITEPELSCIQYMDMTTRREGDCITRASMHARTGLGIACADAGFDHVYGHQVGPDQEGFFDFYSSDVLPRLSR